MHEAVLLSRLVHNHIMAFRGIIKAPDSSNPKSIVFELAHSDLERCLKPEGMARAQLLTLFECKRIGIHLLSGLAYLAANIVVHRDLKPANVLVFITDDGTVFKIGDVGLAKYVSKRRDTARRTRHPHVHRTKQTNVGTALYCAPEIPRGFYGLEVDVFSFGVLMLEVIATSAIPGTPFPVFSSPYELPGMCACVRDWLVSQNQFAFAALLEECVAVDPSARPTASAALSRLVDVVVVTEPLAAAAPVTAQPVSLSAAVSNIRHGNDGILTVSSS